MVRVPRGVQYWRHADGLLRGDFDRAVTEGEAVVTAVPDYREAYFDLAQAYYWKMQGQGDDPALRGKALQVYRKLMELEHENPRLPAENLSFLQDLYGPVIDSVPGGG